MSKPVTVYPLQLDPLFYEQCRTLAAAKDMSLAAWIREAMVEKATGRRAA